MVKIIPSFRQGAHFALEYFGDFGDSPKNVFIGLLKNPLLISQYLFRKDTYEYLFKILGPVGFLSLFSPLHLFIAAPEFAINILSKSEAMRNIYYHYAAVITPFVIISAIYGLKSLMSLMQITQKYVWLLLTVFIICIMSFSATISPLPYSLGREIHPFVWPINERFEAFKWGDILANDSLKVMTSGHIGPLFSSRRYLYNFSEKYYLADYIVLSYSDIYNGYENYKSIPAYEKLVKDIRYTKIYKKGFFEVYKKI